MPIYCYTCKACGLAQDEFQKMTSLPLTDCPRCRQMGSYGRVPTLPHTDLKEFHTPIELLSIAMEDPDQIKDFLGKCPDVECSLDPASPTYGVPIARNRSQKRHALEAAGFAENN